MTNDTEQRLHISTVITTAQQDCSSSGNYPEIHEGELEQIIIGIPHRFNYVLLLTY